MRVAILGRTRVLLQSLKTIEEAGHNVVLIGTCPEAKEYGLKDDEFAFEAKNRGIPFFNNPQINHPEIVGLLNRVKADVAISVNWLTMIGKEAIGAFPFGILNAHAGDLPRFRGNACPNWAILNGEKHIALTIHQMDADDLDAGPILCKEIFNINDDTRIKDIYNFVEERAPQLFLKALNGLEHGTIVPQRQSTDPYLSLRCYPRIPSDSYLDWNQNAIDLSRLVRASSEPFSGAYTYFQGHKITIWQAYAQAFSSPSLAMPGHVVWRSIETGEVGIATGDGVLVLKEVERESEGRVKPSDLIKSKRIRMGMAAEDEIYELRKRVSTLERLLGGIPK